MTVVQYQQLAQTMPQSKFVEFSRSVFIDGRSTKNKLARIASMRVHARRKQKPLPLDRLQKTIQRSPWIVKAFIVTVMTGFPFNIFLGLAFTKYRHQEIENAQGFKTTYQRLAVWLEIVWLTFLIIFAYALVVGHVGLWLCNMSVRTIRYAPLAKTMCIRLTMLAWCGVVHRATAVVWPHASNLNKAGNWVFTLRQTAMFLLIACAIIFIQGFCLQLIAIQYVEGYVGPRSSRAIDELETIQALNNLVKPHLGNNDPGQFSKLMRKLFLPAEENVFDELRKGHCDDDVVYKCAGLIWDTIAAGKSEITSADVCLRLREMHRDPDKGEELFLLLDETCDGMVGKAELENAVIKTAAQLKKRASAMRGIQLLLRKLEILLIMILFGVIVFIYTIFFPQDWAKDVKALWTGVVALSFAFSGPVAETVNSCVFVFAKHAYDVGDLVGIKDRLLLVKQIFLTHTNFEELAKPTDEWGKVVQIAHSSLTEEVITNWTRSNDVAIEQQDEQVTIDSNEALAPSPPGFAATTVDPIAEGATATTETYPESTIATAQITSVNERRPCDQPEVLT